MIKNPTEQQWAESICNNCHWKDKNDNLCHAIEPPIKILYAMDRAGECWYIPYTYWNRISQEHKDRFNEDVRIRSEKYYKKHRQDTKMGHVTES